MKPAILIEKPAEGKGRVHNLTELVGNKGSEITLGRGPRNIIDLGSDFYAVKKGFSAILGISRRHATIIYNSEKDVFSIRDDNSSGGTTMRQAHRDEDLISLEGGSVVELTDGDEIYFGEREYGPVS